MKQYIDHFDICPHLHAMSDVGFAHYGKTVNGETYNKPRTNNAECYAEKCNRYGRCLIANIVKIKEGKK